MVTSVGRSARKTEGQEPDPEPGRYHLSSMTFDDAEKSRDSMRMK